LSHELTEVKQSYVHVCADKDKMEERLKQELSEMFENVRAFEMHCAKREVDLKKLMCCDRLMT